MNLIFLIVALSILNVVNAVLEKGKKNDLSSTFNDDVASVEYVLIAFGAQWCPYSRALQEVFNQLGPVVTQDNVRIAVVDCVAAKEICSRFAITKYPTIKLFKDGFPRALEYRGARDVKRFQHYLEKETSLPVKEHGSVQEYATLSQDGSTKSILGYFPENAQDAKRVFIEVAESLREFCQFHSVVSGAIKIQFKLKGETIDYNDVNDITNNFRPWATEKCKPLIDELTFENSEAMVEDQLPLVILFTQPDDVKSISFYKEMVEKHVKDKRNRVKFLYADGNKFLHPLQHIHKTPKDLPVLAIDSFKHLYAFDEEFSHLDNPDVFQNFIKDLFNQQHHEHFHRGNPNAHECHWRQTGDCNPRGPREMHSDKDCEAFIKDEHSGFCECGHGEILEFSCEKGRAQFTCTEKCNEAMEKHAVKLENCLFKRTGNCDPKGTIEHSKDCKTVIKRGESGFCDCQFMGIRIDFTCDHDDFKCEDFCIKEGTKKLKESGEKVQEHDEIDHHAKLGHVTLDKNEGKEDSAFVKLGPSNRKYSFVKDEL